jgi:Tol biopolymer transport system component
VNEIGWTPDGQAILYLRFTSLTTNLCMQPLNGGPAVQLTHFDSEPSLVGIYAWSRDGKKIAIMRSRPNDTSVVAGRQPPSLP